MKEKRKLKTFLKNIMWNFLRRKKKEKLASNEVSNYLKNEFKSFFEGIRFGEEYLDNPIIAVPLMKFGITDIKVVEGTELTKSKLSIKTIDMYITLERPGILIGKGGQVINRLERYLNGPQHKDVLKNKVNVKIFESKLWD